jgi:uncharacterized protein (TIGR03067 family)
MRRLIVAAAFLALAVPVSRADEKADAAKKLNGTYQVVEVIVNGKPDDKKKDDVSGVVIKDGTITIKDKRREETAKFTVDPSKKPAHIDIAPKGDDEKVPGIYELKEAGQETELTIAFAKTGSEGPEAERPKDFKGEGRGAVVLKLLRKKEK